jgi:hypothetical protein
MWKSGIALRPALPPATMKRPFRPSGAFCPPSAKPISREPIAGAHNNKKSLPSTSGDLQK